MPEDRAESIPNAFKATDTGVASSVGKDVYGYQQERKVLKVIKEGARDSYTSGQEAIQSIKENEAQRQRVRDLLQQLGSMQEIVPQTSSVVHRANSQDREVTYSEVQPWLQGARPLSKIKGDLRNLPY